MQAAAEAIQPTLSNLRQSLAHSEEECTRQVLEATNNAVAHEKTRVDNLKKDHAASSSPHDPSPLSPSSLSLPMVVLCLCQTLHVIPPPPLSISMAFTGTLW